MRNLCILSHLRVRDVAPLELYEAWGVFAPCSS